MRFQLLRQWCARKRENGVFEPQRPAVLGTSPSLSRLSANRKRSSRPSFRFIPHPFRTSSQIQSP